MCVMACVLTPQTTNSAKPWPSDSSQKAGVRSASRAVKSRVVYRLVSRRCRTNFNRVSISQILNQPDPSDFAWGIKTPIWNELNIREGEACVKNKRPLMMIDENKHNWLK